MLIRQEQMRTLEASVLETFRLKLLTHLRETFPEETKDVSDAALFAIIDAEVKRGAAYNITTQRAIMLFTDLRFFRTPHFEQAADMEWAKKILENKELEGEVKMRLIYQCLAASDQGQETA